MKIHSVYDAGGSGDRFTVYYKGRGSLSPTFVRIGTPGKLGNNRRYQRTRMCLGMSGAPFHPQGVCQHGYGIPGRHNGKRIKFEDLPADCKKAVMQDLEG